MPIDGLVAIAMVQDHMIAIASSSFAVSASAAVEVPIFNLNNLASGGGVDGPDLTLSYIQ